MSYHLRPEIEKMAQMPVHKKRQTKRGTTHILGILQPTDDLLKSFSPHRMGNAPTGATDNNRAKITAY